MKDADAHADLVQPARAGARLWLVAFALALLLYGLTAHRGMQWQDSGWQQVRIASGQLDHPLGLALTHPLQYHLGRIAMRVLPCEPPLAITLVSSFAGALAVANVALTILLLTQHKLAAALGAGALLVAHTFWQHAAHTESYALVAALLTAEWLLIARYLQHRRPEGLVALAAVNGLGVATHLLAGLATPVNVVLIAAALWRKPAAWRWSLLAVGAWLCGALPYLGLIALEWEHTGDLAATVQSALFGKFAGDVLNTDVGGRMLLLSLGYVGYNFPNLALPLALLGLLRPVGLPKLLRRALLAELAIYVLFVMRYSIVDQYTFFLPIYALLAVHVGIGAAFCLQRLRSRGWRKLLLSAAALSILLTPLIYVATAATLRSRGALRSLVGNKPYRDGYRTFFIPWGVGENSLDTLTRRAIELAGGGDGGGVLVPDSMARFGFDYAQRTGALPPNVFWKRVSLDAHDDATWRRVLASWRRAGLTVVLVPVNRDDPAFAADVVVWRRVGDLYVLEDLLPAPG